MRSVAFSVNGTRHELDLEPRELLVYVLRDRLRLTGTEIAKAQALVKLFPEPPPESSH